MPKHIYCAECGKTLTMFRKALPNYGVVVDLVIPHTCLKNPKKFDLEPVDVPAYDPKKSKHKFVKKLNNLAKPLPSPSAVANAEGAELRDRRSPEQVKSTAPDSLLKSMSRMPNSTPDRDLVGMKDE